LIDEAYAVLGNKTLRSIYDQRLLGKNGAGQELTYDSILTASRQNFPEPKQAELKTTYKIDENFEKQLKEKTDWVGEDLKNAREYKNISVERMSDKIKVNSYYITAVENMDSSNLPAPVFVRGYVVQISKHLGLNDKLVADSYMKSYKATVS
jgi:curved DNA-binding protein CbpA